MKAIERHILLRVECVTAGVLIDMIAPKLKDDAERELLRRHVARIVAADEITREVLAEAPVTVEGRKQHIINLLALPRMWKQIVEDGAPLLLKHDLATPTGTLTQKSMKLLRKGMAKR